jgi:hypothetical protein
MGQAAYEATFLKSGDQAVDPGFGFQLERCFHLVERRRHPMLLQVLVDEKKQLVLFFGQHGFRLPTAPKRGHI